MRLGSSLRETNKNTTHKAQTPTHDMDDDDAPQHIGRNSHADSRTPHTLFSIQARTLLSSSQSNPASPPPAAAAAAAPPSARNHFLSRALAARQSTEGSAREIYGGTECRGVEWVGWGEVR